MKRSEIYLAKLCGMLLIVGGIGLFLYISTAGLIYPSTFLVGLFVLVFGIALILVSPKHNIAKASNDQEKIAELGKIVVERREKVASKDDKILVAHYDTGNIKDPLGILHDEKGEPILLTNEKILHSTSGILLDAHKWLRDKFFQATSMTTFSNAGEGCIYLTNNRMIYLREPNPMKQLSEGGPLGAPKYIPLALQSKEWLEKGRLEGISIPLTYISKVTKKGIMRKKIYIEAICDGYIYRIFVRPVKKLNKIFFVLRNE